MRVHVKIHPHLRQCIARADAARTLEVPEGASARHVVDLLNLPGDFPVVVMINGSFCDDVSRALLREQDELVITPVMAGG